MEAANSSAADSPWQDLPLDLILNISSFLLSRIDRLRFRSVCKSWRSSIPKTPSPDSHPIPFSQSLFPRRFNLTLSECPIYLISSSSSSSSSIVGIEEIKGGRKVRARHPVSGKHLTLCGKVVDLTQLRVLEVGKLFHLICAKSYAECKRVVASIDNLTAAIEDVRLMCICDEKLMHFKLGDQKWVTICHGAPRFPYADVIHIKGKFYAVDEARRVVIVDCMMNVEVVNSPDVLSAGLMSNSDTSYLVNRDGDLYLLVLYYAEEDDIRDPFNTKFLVYKFIESERDWVRVMSLGDWAVFVSRFGSFAVPVQEVSMCQKNCIYFQLNIEAEDEENSSFNRENFCFIAVFDVDKGSCDNIAYDFRSSRAVISWPLCT